MKKYHLLTAALLFPSDGNSYAGVAVTLPDLLRSAFQWAWQAIISVESAGGKDKLKRAAADFGEALCKFVDSLEARAGVLGGFLNSAGVDAIEHMAIMRAVEAGGDALAALLQNVIQNVFTAKRIEGAI